MIEISIRLRIQYFFTKIYTAKENENIKALYKF